METRANHVWVGAITLLLLIGAAAFFVWLSRMSGSEAPEYDIFFEQSVGGVAVGSPVSYSGVPVGQVIDVGLLQDFPEFVHVRIRVEEDVPILVGTVASVSPSFTGPSSISLSGGQNGAQPITCETTACPLEEGIPVIPPAPGLFGELAATAPLLLQRLATLTDRLTRVLDDENQESISGILNNTQQISGQLAAATPEVQATMRELQSTLAQSTQTLASFEDTLQSVDTLVEDEGQALSAELRTTLASARQAAAALEGSLSHVEPLAQQLSQETLPTATATLRDLRRTSENLRQLTERIETEGATSLLGGPALPDYEP